jgi:hypothetical protein
MKRFVMAAAAFVCGLAMATPVEPQWLAASGDETSLVLIDISTNLKGDGSHISGQLLHLDGATYKDFLRRFAALDHISVNSMPYASVVERLFTDQLQVNEAVKQIHTTVGSFEVDCRKDKIRIDDGEWQQAAPHTHGYRIEAAACSRTAHAGKKPITPSPR